MSKSDKATGRFDWLSVCGVDHLVLWAAWTLALGLVFVLAGLVAGQG